MVHAGRVRITTLGPLAVDGTPVRGERLAVVVRVLVEARGRPVAPHVLVEAVWDGAPPQDEAGAVQALVSRVRRLGLPVATVPGGYQLPADAVEVDAVRVRALLDQARDAADPTTALRLSDAARALFPDVPGLEEPHTRRLFVAVTAARAEAALAGGGTADEDDLRLLVAAEPPDEPSAAMLVRILAAQGREAAALEVVEQVRARLADAYGTDPSAVLAQAHLRLLRGELAGGPTPVRTPRYAPLPPGWRRAATPLLGRADDLAAVESALQEAPLVTIVASGGAGKTRLAAEVARRCSGEVRVVELAGVRGAQEVLPALLSALGGAETVATGERDRRALDVDERIARATADLEALVVVDNCEHVVAAAADTVGRLLQVAPPGLTVLATSRTPLGLVGEVVHPLGALPDADALALLRARAGRVTGWHVDLALALCHRLDNLPLALELAAARLRHMPLPDVLAGLADRFGLLDDALRGLPERHASLWTLVDWSRELLEPEERDLLARLSVVPAPFTADLASAVAGGRDVARSLAALVEQSLLVLEDDGTRWRMLETVREYAVVRLEETGRREEALTGLVCWARARAAALTGDLNGPGQVAALAACATDQDSLLAALRTGIEREDDAGAVDIAAALLWSWTVRGLHLEALTWAGRLCRAEDPQARSRSALLHGATAGKEVPHPERAALVCLLLGISTGITGSTRLYALATRGLRRLLSQHPRLSERPRVLAAAMFAMTRPDPEPGLREADAMVEHPDLLVQGVGLLLRAGLLENSGRPLDSPDDAQQAYARFAELGDHWGMGAASQSAGQWLIQRGRPDADEWLARSEHHLGLVGAAQDVTFVRILRDVHLALGGDTDAAARLADSVASGQLEPTEAMQAHLGLGRLAAQEHRWDEAVAHSAAVRRLLDAEASQAPQVPQARLFFAAGAAALQSHAAEALPGHAVEGVRRAAALLAATLGDALATTDVPALSAWALGLADLAAHLPEPAAARELWALGTRLGGGTSSPYLCGEGVRLTLLLGDDQERAQLLAATADRTIQDSLARLRALAPQLLEPHTLRR